MLLINLSKTYLQLSKLNSPIMAGDDAVSSVPADDMMVQLVADDQLFGHRYNSDSNSEDDRTKDEKYNRHKDKNGKKDKYKEGKKDKDKEGKKDKYKKGKKDKNKEGKKDKDKEGKKDKDKEGKKDKYKEAKKDKYKKDNDKKNKDKGKKNEQQNSKSDDHRRKKDRRYYTDSDDSDHERERRYKSKHTRKHNSYSDSEDDRHRRRRRRHRRSESSDDERMKDIDMNGLETIRRNRIRTFVHRRREGEDDIVSSWKTRSDTSAHGELKAEVWSLYIGASRTGQCFCCGTSISKSKWKCSYIVPRSEFGTKNVDNYRPLCKICHRDRGIMNLNEYIIMKGKPGADGLGNKSRFSRLYQEMANLAGKTLTVLDDLEKAGHFSETVTASYRARIIRTEKPIGERISLMQNIFQYEDRYNN